VKVTENKLIVLLLDGGGALPVNYTVKKVNEIRIICGFNSFVDPNVLTVINTTRVCWVFRFSKRI